MVQVVVREAQLSDVAGRLIDVRRDMEGDVCEEPFRRGGRQTSDVRSSAVGCEWR